MTRPDDDLMAALGTALRTADPVPERVLHAARGAYTWRTIDAELAELVFDSAAELTGVRSEEQARQVTFQAPGVEIEVMLVDGSTRRIVGQLVPAMESTIELTGVDVDRVVATTSDDLGRFTFDEVPPGPVRISVVGDGGTPTVHTEWVLL